MIHMLLSEATYPTRDAISGPSLQHILVTCLAMLLDAARPPSTEWLERRMPIFAHVCLPSAHETLRPDVWLIGVYYRTVRHLGILQRLISHHPWIHLICQRDNEPVPLTFGREVTDVELQHPPTYFVTTEFDCDEALTVNYVGDAGRYASAVLVRQSQLNDSWLSSPLGHQVIRDVFSLCVNPKNHFLAHVVLAPLKPGGGTVSDINHRDVFDANRAGVARFAPCPMWLHGMRGGIIANEPCEDPLEFRPDTRVAALLPPTNRR